jgi:protein-disulfide isomerase
MSKRQEMREKRQRELRTQRILIIVGVAVIGIAIALALILPTLKPVGDIVMPDAGPRPQANFNGAGNPNAPVKIIEYSDFQCPYCAVFSNQTEGLIMDNYVATGKVYFEYRSFGDFIGVESARAAEAAYCAGDQGKFWEMHDIIFANQQGENKGAFEDRRLVAFASNLDLNMTQFNDCFNNDKYADRVKEDGVNAYEAGVRATPSFVINGKLVEGAQPYDVFQQEIEAALAASGQ